MRVPRLRLAALAAASGIALSGCVYGMYGDPYGNGYGSYGGLSVGYGSGYGGYGYGSPYGYGGYYGGYGGYDPFGWYGDYYYPGSGIYVYDRYRNRHRWSDDQQRYWSQRRQEWQSHSGTTTTTGTRENWSGWDRSRWRSRDSNTTATTTAGTRESSRGTSRRSSTTSSSSSEQTQSTDSPRSTVIRHSRTHQSEQPQ
jgi:hypothetical protein